MTPTVAREWTWAGASSSWLAVDLMPRSIPSRLESGFFAESRYQMKDILLRHRERTPWRRIRGGGGLQGADKSGVVELSLGCTRSTGVF